MATEVTLRQLAYFRTAIDEGTMAAAGKRLGVSASAISTAIGDLESALGVRLVVRTAGRGLGLTAAGRRALAHADGVVEMAATIQGRARAGGTDAGGRVRMGCFPPFSPFYVPDLVTAAGDRQPPIELDVVEAPVDELFEQLSHGVLDLALVYDHAIPDGLETEEIRRHYPFVILAGSHHLAGRSSVSLHDLIDEPMVLLRAREASYFEQVVREMGLTPTIVRTTDNMETVRTMVGRGMGWSLLIGRPTAGVSQEGRPIAAARLADDVDGVPVVVTTPAGSTRTRRAQTVVDLCHHIIGRRGT